MVFPLLAAAVKFGAASPTFAAEISKGVAHITRATSTGYRVERFISEFPPSRAVAGGFQCRNRFLWPQACQQSYQPSKPRRGARVRPLTARSVSEAGQTSAASAGSPRQQV